MLVATHEEGSSGATRRGVAKRGPQTTRFHEARMSSLANGKLKTRRAVILLPPSEPSKQQRRWQRLPLAGSVKHFV